MFNGFRASMAERLGTDALAAAKFEEAARHFANVLRLEPGRKNAHYHLGLALLSQKRWAEAEKAFHAERERFANPTPEESHPVDRALAECAFHQARRKDAAKWFRRAGDSAPNERSVRYMNLRTSICENPDRFKQAMDAAKDVDVANAHLEQDDFEQAKEVFARAVDKDPACLQAYNALGTIAMTVDKDYQAAQVWFARADELAEIPSVMANLVRLQKLVVDQEGV